MYNLSPYILAISIAWIVAQGAKFLLSNSSKNGPIDFRKLYTSGNMPSSHSATVIALLTIVGLKDGPESGLFGIATLFAAIVMYDAVMVRRSTGEQGEAIHALIKEQKSKVHTPRAARGHQPLEVAVGAFIGLFIGLLVYLLRL